MSVQKMVATCVKNASHTRIIVAPQSQPHCSVCGFPVRLTPGPVVENDPPQEFAPLPSPIDVDPSLTLEQRIAAIEKRNAQRDADFESMDVDWIAEKFQKVIAKFQALPANERALKLAEFEAIGQSLYSAFAPTPKSDVPNDLELPVGSA